MSCFSKASCVPSGESAGCVIHSRTPPSMSCGSFSCTSRRGAVPGAGDIQPAQGRRLLRRRFGFQIDQMAGRNAFDMRRRGERAEKGENERNARQRAEQRPEPGAATLPALEQGATAPSNGRSRTTPRAARVGVGRSSSPTPPDTGGGGADQRIIRQLELGRLEANRAAPGRRAVSAAGRAGCRRRGIGIILV